MNTRKIIRSLWMLFWFVLVPGVAAALIVQSRAVFPATNPIWSFVHDQPLPVGILVFTVMDMIAYSYRHRLPWARQVSLVGQGLSAELRADIESALHLLDESERVLAKNRTAVEKKASTETVAKLEEALAELRRTVDETPFQDKAFSEALTRASELCHEHLRGFKKSELREYIESITIAVLVALLLRELVVEAFKIPSGSMLPTLQIGDHIFVNKFSYGPTLPFVHERIFADLPPRHGDVIVFEYPEPDPSKDREDFIKRVIAVPGDVLEADGGHPIINGWRVPSCRVGRYERFDSGAFGPKQGDLYVEFLRATAYLAVYEEDHDSGRQGPYYVKPGEVWVMGDNRHNSSDSRAWRGGEGAGVPFGNIKGRAMFVWWPPDGMFSRWFMDVMGNPVLPSQADSFLAEGVRRCLASRPSEADATPPPPSPEAPARRIHASDWQ